MLILWRTILIILCCLATLICYHDYSNGAIAVTITWAVIAFFIMIGLTVASRAILIGKSHIFNTIFDILFIIAFLYILLNIFPLKGGKTPYTYIKKGIYPTMKDIDAGLAKFGIANQKDAFTQIKEDISQIGNDLNEVKTLVLQEHKD